MARRDGTCGFFLLMCIAVSVAGCASPGYYYQAASGHLGLMRERQDINEYLESAPHGDPTAVRLLMAQTMIRFADEELALPSGGAYSTFLDDDRNVVTWNVTVTPELSLTAQTWCFPVAGCVPYRGYFDRDDALRFAEKMSRKGRDAAITGASAYSTLGWFEDPIPARVLRADEATLAETLFHELAHQRLYLKGEAAFNEAYASFVGLEGARRWMLMQNRREALERWETENSRQDEFRALLVQARESLREIYSADLTPAQKRQKKDAAFKHLESSYRAKVDEDWAGERQFDAWFNPPPNNADLVLVSTYGDGMCAFTTLWREADGNFARFHQLADKKSTARKIDRDAWLTARCE